MNGHREWNPLGPAGEVPLELGLVAARAAAAIRRGINGNRDSIDNSALDALQHLLERIATAIEFAESGGEAGDLPSSSFATFTTLELVAAADTAVAPSIADLKAFLDRVLSQLLLVIQGVVDQSTATRLLAFLSSLSEVALRQSGTTGEVADAF